jgi:redox-sensitive bicupin YhaK (pirin superfamily)
MKQIKKVVRDAPQHWVGDGFPVRSLFSYSSSDEFDPFLLLDYAGPHEFAPQEAKRGVGEHPHRGFETVAILFLASWNIATPAAAAELSAPATSSG